MCRQPLAAARCLRRSLRPARRTRAGVLHVVDPVQRLEPFGPARPAHDERPALLPRGHGSAVARRPRGGTPPVHRGRRLASAANLGDGHRQFGSHRRWPSGGLPHQSGRQQAADAGRWTSHAGVRGHRPRTGRHRPPTLRRRRRAPVDRLASRVRRHQQRRRARPVRDQGQRRGATRVRHARSQQPVARPGRRHVRGGGRRGRGRQLRAGTRRGSRGPQPRRAARHRRRQPPRAGGRVAQHRRGRIVGRRPFAPAGAERRGHRRVGRDACRRSFGRPRGDRRRWPCQWPARLDPPRAGRRRRGRSTRHVARRRDRPLDDSRGRTVRDDRAGGDRRRGTPGVEA